MKLRFVLLPAFLILIVCPPPAAAQEPGPWRVSAGYVYVDLSADGQLHGITGSGIAPSDDGSGMVSVLYQPNLRWGIEVLIAPPFEHAIDATGSLAGLGTIVTLESMPMTVQARRVLLSPAHALRPFVGLGLTYARFVGESATESLSRLAGTGLDVEFGNDLGLILSAGLELALTRQWSLEFAAAYSNLDPEIHLSGPGLEISGEAPLRTIAYTTEIGYRF